MLSLCSDMSHELVTAAMPLFLASFGAGAAALGTIEGVSDAASSLLKLWMSVYSDRVGHRKPLLVIGYAVTGLMGTFAFVTAWWQMVVIRGVAWIGRGARGPVRDALLSESVPAEAHGRAFGFQTAMDTTGAILGPLIALTLVGVLPLRRIFLVAFIPGAAAVWVATFALRDVHRAAQPALRLVHSLHALPSRFWRFALAVGVFGLGNFAHTLLILRAATMLAPAYGPTRGGRIAIALYVFHNMVYAITAFPVGWLGDRVSKVTLLAIGYALFALMCAGFIVARPSVVMLVPLFLLAGVYIAIVDSMERAFAAGLLPGDLRGTGFGALATVNAIGDLVSSITVGFLWSHVSVAAGFGYAGCFTLAGAVLLAIVARARPLLADSPAPR